MEGDLDLAGTTRPLAFAVSLTGGHIRGTATVKQTAWGIDPYTAPFGVLKVLDDVEVVVDGTIARG